MSLLVGAALAWTSMAATFSLVAASRVWRVRRRAQPPSGHAPAVLLLRPVESPSALELENLCATLDYAGELETVVVGPARPALPRGIGFVESNPSSPNRKVGHLLAALGRSPSAGRVVLSIDADVRVDGGLVSALAAAVQSGAALSFAAPEPTPGRGLAARAVRALLTRSHHAFRALDVMSVGAKPVCGKAVGLGATALEELPRVAVVAGEDLELAVRLFARGERVELVAPSATVPQGRVGPRGALARFTRWMLVLKAHRPALFPAVPLLFAPTPALIALALATGSLPLCAAVAVLAVVRAALARALLPSAPGEWAWAEWLLGELLLCAAFLRALFTRRLVWRGRAFVLGRGGRMVPA